MATIKNKAKSRLTCIVNNQSPTVMPTRSLESTMHEIEEMASLFKLMHPEVTAHMLRMARDLVIQFPARPAPELRVINCHRLA